MGYRRIHQKQRQLGYFIDKETVRLCLKILDPSGVELRICRRLQRRAYLSPGPDHTWHIDGYDKLKPYGFAIHGAIDGYSRRIVWLYVSASNNNPSNIAFYFLQTITELSMIPQVVRGDRGSENVVVCGVQRFLRRDLDDTLSGQASFRYGSSTSNQRIEAWWSQFRRAKGTWWINFFKDLIDFGIYDNSINYHVEMLRFCFMSIIQHELDEMKKIWNTHYIREVRNSESPPGRPNVLYSLPERSGGRNCSFSINMNDAEVCNAFVEQPSITGCTDHSHELARLIMHESALELPTSAAEAKNLFVTLIQNIEVLLG